MSSDIQLRLMSSNLDEDDTSPHVGQEDDFGAPAQGAMHGKPTDDGFADLIAKSVAEERAHGYIRDPELSDRLTKLENRIFELTIQACGGSGKNLSHSAISTGALATQDMETTLTETLEMKKRRFGLLQTQNEWHYEEFSLLKSLSGHHFFLKREKKDKKGESNGAPAEAKVNRLLYLVENIDDQERAWKTKKSTSASGSGDKDPKSPKSPQSPKEEAKDPSKPQKLRDTVEFVPRPYYSFLVFVDSPGSTLDSKRIYELRSSSASKVKEWRNKIREELTSIYGSGELSAASSDSPLLRELKDLHDRYLLASADLHAVRLVNQRKTCHERHNIKKVYETNKSKEINAREYLNSLGSKCTVYPKLTLKVLEEGKEEVKWHEYYAGLFRSQIIAFKTGDSRTLQQLVLLKGTRVNIQSRLLRANKFYVSISNDPFHYPPTCEYGFRYPPHYEINCGSLAELIEFLFSLHHACKLNLSHSSDVFKYISSAYTKLEHTQDVLEFGKEKELAAAVEKLIKERGGEEEQKTLADWKTLNSFLIEQRNLFTFSSSQVTNLIAEMKSNGGKAALEGARQLALVSSSVKGREMRKALFQGQSKLAQALHDKLWDGIQALPELAKAKDKWSEQMKKIGVSYPTKHKE